MGKNDYDWEWITALAKLHKRSPKHPPARIKHINPRIKFVTLREMMHRKMLPFCTKEADIKNSCNDACQPQAVFRAKRNTVVIKEVILKVPRGPM